MSILSITIIGIALIAIARQINCAGTCFGCLVWFVIAAIALTIMEVI